MPGPYDPKHEFVDFEPVEIFIADPEVKPFTLKFQPVVLRVNPDDSRYLQIISKQTGEELYLKDGKSQLASEILFDWWNLKDNIPFLRKRISKGQKKQRAPIAVPFAQLNCFYSDAYFWVKFDDDIEEEIELSGKDLRSIPFLFSQFEGDVPNRDAFEQYVANQRATKSYATLRKNVERDKAISIAEELPSTKRVTKLSIWDRDFDDRKTFIGLMVGMCVFVAIAFWLISTFYY